jgi:hypothetical protein
MPRTVCPLDSRTCVLLISAGWPAPKEVPLADAHEQTLAQLRLLAHLPGFWELRALRRAGAQLSTNELLRVYGLAAVAACGWLPNGQQ